MHHSYNACFTMILFDYNIFFSIHLVICLYGLVEVLLVLMPCTYKERFLFLHLPYVRRLYFCLQLHGSFQFLFGSSTLLLWFLVIWETFSV